MLSKDVFEQLGAELGRRQKRASTTKEANVFARGFGALGKMLPKANLRAGLSSMGSGMASPFRNAGSAMRDMASSARGAASTAYGAATPKRTALATTGLIGGAGALGHARNAINDAMSDPTDRFTAASQQYERMLPAAQEQGLSLDQIREGNFGGSMFSFGGWNPFASRNARHYGDIASTAVNDMNKQYADLTKPPDVSGLPAQLQSLQKEMTTTPFPGYRRMLANEMDKIKKKMTYNPAESREAQTLRARMRTAGMPDPMGQFAEPRDLPSGQAPPQQWPMPDYSRLAGGDYSPRPEDYSIRPGMAGFY